MFLFEELEAAVGCFALGNGTRPSPEGLALESVEKPLESVLISKGTGKEDGHS
jgi:hypothetical protein